MARQPKEYQAFTSLVDKLLTVPKSTILEREADHKKRPPTAAANETAPAVPGAPRQHSNTCDLVGWRQGYNSPAACSCGADPGAMPPDPDLRRRAEQWLASITKAKEWQCLRRDRNDGGIEYQIFADCEPDGEQIAWVQSTRHDAEFIAAAPLLLRDLLALIADQAQQIADSEAALRGPDI